MNEDIFESLKQGMKEAVDFKKANQDLRSCQVEIEIPDVRNIRKQTGLTQVEFAALFGWSKNEVSSWERGRCVPEHSARAMLKLIAKDPAYVVRVLQE